jgi:2-haloacid dehalogenase
VTAGAVPPVPVRRRDFLAVAAIGAAGALPSPAADSPIEDARQELTAMKRPRCLFFDVNETLLDLGAMKASVAQALGGRTDLLPLWFTTLLHYSLVATVADRFEDFGRLGAAALQVVAGNHGIELSQEAARKAIAPMRSLPPHQDVVPALEQLRHAGFRLVTLTNSSRDGLEAQMRNAGLTSMFDEHLSMEDIQLYKPHGHTYRWAARKMGMAPPDCMHVAAHGWDVAGAMWAGWRAAFVARPGAQLYPLADRPEIVEPDLKKVAERLIALNA